MWDLADWRERAWVASQRAAALDPDNLGPASQLFDLALTEGDTAEARRQSIALTRMASVSGCTICGWSGALEARLRLALATADTALAARLWAEVEKAHGDSARGVLGKLHGGLVVDGRGLRELDRLFALAGPPTPGAGRLARVWAFERGRYGEWRLLQEFFYRSQGPYGAAFGRINNALFLGEPEDSSVRASAAYLDQVATGAISVTDSTDPAWVHVVVRAASGCASALWQLAHGQSGGARQVLRYITIEMPALRGPRLPVRASVCAGLITALLAEREGGDVHAAVLQLDSIARPRPFEAGIFPSPAMTSIVLAGLLARYGEPVRALSTLRRGCPWEPWRANMDAGLIVPCLRLEGRLAALTGDRAGAVRAYEHYLALREDPEPPWRAQRDSVVAELAALKPRR
jgi:hypothetical protein